MVVGPQEHLDIIDNTSIDRKQHEETLDHTKIKAHFLPFSRSAGKGKNLYKNYN